MECKRRTLFLAAIIGVAVIVVGGFASALPSMTGAAKSVVFAKVYGYGDWITVDSTWIELMSINCMYIPISGYYQVVCDGYVHTQTGELEIAIGVDSPIEDESTRRFYRADDQSLLTGIHTERVYYLRPGAHTFYFLAQKYGGIGDPTVNYHTMTVTFFTDGSLIDLSPTSDGSGTLDGSP